MAKHKLKTISRSFHTLIFVAMLTVCGFVNSEALANPCEDGSYTPFEDLFNELSELDIKIKKLLARGDLGSQYEIVFQLNERLQVLISSFLEDPAQFNAVEFGVLKSEIGMISPYEQPSSVAVRTEVSPPQLPHDFNDLLPDVNYALTSKARSLQGVVFSQKLIAKLQSLRAEPTFSDYMKKALRFSLERTLPSGENGSNGVKMLIAVSAKYRNQNYRVFEVTVAKRGAGAHRIFGYFPTNDPILRLVGHFQDADHGRSQWQNLMIRAVEQDLDEFFN